MSTVGYITLRFPISIETDGGTFESPPESYLYAGDVEVVDHSIPADLMEWLDESLCGGDVFIDFTPGGVAKALRPVEASRDVGSES